MKWCPSLMNIVTRIKATRNVLQLLIIKRGHIVPVLTPFKNDSKRALNLTVIPQYAAYLANKGITGVLVNGTSGEGMSMSVAERKLVVEAWANAVKTTKQHLMVQIGGASLPDVLELAKHAESMKADSLLCLPELYFKPNTSEQLIEYLKLVGNAAPNTSLLYYHIPMFTNVNIHMGQFLQSIGEELPTFVGIKFTSTNLEEGAQALNANNKKYVIFLGSDQIMSAAYTLGIDSFIATSVNMFPELALEILEAGKSGNFLKQKEKQEQLSKAVISISKYGNWVETMKLAMSLMTDINIGPTRAPLKVLPSENSTLMARDLMQLGYHDALQKMRQIDDKIIYTLNTTIPTESFKDQIDATVKCKDLFEQIETGHAQRELAITKCVNVTKEKVKKLKAQRDNGEDSPALLKNLRKEQNTLRLLQSQLNVEEIVMNRTTRVYYEKCRTFYKPHNLEI